MRKEKDTDCNGISMESSKNVTGNTDVNEDSIAGRVGDDKG